jgi:hypothetical protein
LPYGVVGDVGGSAKFASDVNVQAVLCRIDSSLSTPSCALKPGKGNRVAITFISHASLPGEGGRSTIKETWASYSDSNPSASVPLIGSGFVKGLGNAQIVANPNAGGYGVPVSIWSPNDVGIGSVPGGACKADKGVGSVATCQLGEYLKNTPASELKTTCADVNNACDCPAVSGSENNFLSGHSQAVKKEGIDILDIDNNDGTLPDAGYFPGVDCNKQPLDDLTDDSDDSLFEFVFNVSNVVDRGNVDTNQDCNGGDCAIFHLIENLGADDSLSNCDGLNETSSGLYYISGPCNGMPPQVGSPGSPVVVVVEEEVTLNGQTNFYGLLFIRSKDQSASMKGAGGAKIFGSLVVEGDIDLSGSLHIVYDNTAISSDPNILPSNVKFARVPGSWLDATEGF